MSVVGFDVGNDTLVVAAARQGGIDVLLNAESKRESPAAVAFSHNARLLGVHAAGASSAHAPFSNVKRLLIGAARPAQLLRDIPRLPFPVSAGDGAVVHVDHIGRRIALSPTQLLSMLLAYLKQLAEADLDAPVVECVISVPCYFTQAQRRAYLDAAAIAGLRPLRLMHDLAATALGYGLYRSDLVGAGGPTHVAFVDIGHCDTQIAVVAFDASGMKVLAHGFDADLGGRDFDEVLFEHFSEEFKERYNIDVIGNVKASMRLRAACEKAKKVLSANAEAVVNIECLMEEKDVRGVIRREEFEKLCAGLLDRVVEPCMRAVADSGIAQGCHLLAQLRRKVLAEMARIEAGVVLAVTVLACALGARADGSDHKYKDGDHVPLYANKVGPFHNPSETYRYYDLPFCAPEHPKDKKEALGEVLNGDRLVDAPYELNFKEDKNSKTLCKKTLTKEQVAKLRDAVAKDYYFQMYYDDLPLWGFLGKLDKNKEQGDAKYLLFKHIHFDIMYNNNRVIEINVQTDPNVAVDITEDKEMLVEFSYSVSWKKTDIPFEKRMEKYSKSSSMPQHLEIHWFSIINSCVTVLLLTGFLATILMRVLKNDFIKYSHDEESLEDQEETGWKYIHGDVFRFPLQKSLFAAIIGSGTQLLALAIFIFLLAIVGVFYPYNRGALFTALVVIYALTSGIAGYTATSFYLQLEGTNWVRNLILTGCLFCGPLFLTFSFLNTVAIAYSATAALPFGTIIVIILIWALVTSPLLVFGGIAGKNSNTEFQAPCRTTKYPREIPQLPWYRSTIPQMAMAGFLPFSAIYIELYYIFASIWGHKIYTIYSILFIVFIILIIVTAFVTVALTYFQLAVEDHEWWWRSVLCGGSTGIFVFFYCIYYYHARSDMSGFMQTSFFFGYMTCVCYGFFLMLGTVGFRASLLFVRHIYRSIKCE